MLLSTTQQLANNVPSGALIAFPYILFGALGIAILALLAELAQELRRTRVVQDLIHKQELLAEERDAFWHLAANYLRAPVTLIVGGAEALRESSTTPEAAVISSLAASLQIKVGEIMSKIEGSTSLQAITVSQEHPEVKATRKTIIIVPLVIVGILTLIGDYVATGYRTLNLTPVGYATQVVIFVVVGCALYWAVDALNKGKGNRQIAEATLKQQSEELANSRHELIEETAGNLHPDLTRLEGLLKNLPAPLAIASSGAMETIHQGVSRLREIVTSFSLLIRIQEGTGAVTATPEAEIVDLNTILGEVRAEHMTETKAKGVRIATPTGALQVATEYDMARQVLESIIANAVDYSPANGLISVEATRLPNAIQLRISDQGKGIYKKQLEHLFQPFVRTDGKSAMDMSHGGFGINLYLDKLIMEQMGGSISAESTRGKGTAITMTWPKPQKS